ncbi:MAG: choice-of-anchor tandem repeat GloVer-containing protein, partial [Candidatus Acidiferrales bacterium]
FKITPSGVFTSLYSFCTQDNCTDGSHPYYDSLVQATDGNLYGTTWLGGAGGGNRCSNGCGTIFRIGLDGRFTTVHGFNFDDGQLPYAGMIQASDGNLYGTTSSGGSHDDGTIYAFNPGIPPNPEQFISVTPCRVVDTRKPPGPFGGPAITGDTARSFTIPQGPCAGIPADAAAYSLNVTVVPHGPLGYLTIWPTGQGQPVVSTMNSLDGRIKADAAIVPAGISGAVSVYVTNTTDVLLDINGYFASPSAQTFEFYPLPPCRVIDTRIPVGHLGGPLLAGGAERDFPVLESPCLVGLPLQPEAYSFNFTVIPNPEHQPLDYLTVWPQGGTLPTISTLNNPTATLVANAAIVPAGTNGGIAVYASRSTDLAVDINGYFATPGSGGLSLYPVTPCRVIDTRHVGNGQPFTGELTVNVVGSACSPSVNAQAFVFNATVVPSGQLGYLTLYPDGVSRPVVSTLNAADAAITSNMAIVPTTNGSIDAYAAGLTQLILDISGYFAP